MKKLQHIVQSIIILILLSTMQSSAWESISLEDSYGYFDRTTETATATPNKNVKYYTLILKESTNLRISLSNMAAFECADSEISGIDYGDEYDCENLNSHISLREGNENGMVLATDKYDIRKKLSAGNYTIEIIFDDDSWGDISLYEFEEVSTEQEDISTGSGKDYELLSLTPSIHKADSYAKYYTFKLDESQYLSFHAWSDTIMMAEIEDDFDENDIVKTSIYIIEGEDKNGKLIANGTDSLITSLDAGTYTIELTIDEPNISDYGFFEIKPATAPVAIINYILFDN